MNNKLFDYVERDNVIYNLSGISKLICFFLLTFSVMYTFDIRVIIAIFVFSVYILKVSEIKYSQIQLMIYYVGIFLVLNFVLTFLFEPLYGVEIYGTQTELFRLSNRYIVTVEQLFYQLTRFGKYVSVVPLGMIFLLTTNPSEFAASISSVGLPYQGGYAVSLTMRYFPDMIRSYTEISQAQQSRGLEMSKDIKIMERIKNVMNVCLPLVFSTLDRIDLISNAMDLRGFGKYKKRTWYAQKKLNIADFMAISICTIILFGVLYIGIVINKGRFYNPFI